MSSSQDSISSSIEDIDWKKFVIESVADPLVKGTICGTIHLVVFYALKRKYWNNG